MDHHRHEHRILGPEPIPSCDQYGRLYWANNTAREACNTDETTDAAVNTLLVLHAGRLWRVTRVSPLPRCLSVGNRRNLKHYKGESSVREGPYISPGWTQICTPGTQQVNKAHREDTVWTLNNLRLESG